MTSTKVTGDGHGAVVDKPGVEVAQEILRASEEDAKATPLDTMLNAAVTEDQMFRLLGHLWALKRMMYYVYGSWALGLNVNEYPSTVAYLLSKQIYDDSTHEMQYVDEILRRKWVRTQADAFEHPYCKYSTATRISYYVFTVRGMANFSHNIRAAAMNLGSKVIELRWLERFGQDFPDLSLRSIFAGQVPEVRSHVQMGRLIVEKYMSKAVDMELARREAEVVRNDYLSALDEISLFVSGVDPAEIGDVQVIPADLD